MVSAVDINLFRSNCPSVFHQEAAYVSAFLNVTALGFTTNFDALFLISRTMRDSRDSPEFYI